MSENDHEANRKSTKLSGSLFFKVLKNLSSSSFVKILNLDQMKEEILVLNKHDCIKKKPKTYWMMIRLNLRFYPKIGSYAL